MAYGREKLKKPCHSKGHRFTRYVKKPDGKMYPVPVGLSTPLPTDFCLHCKKTRDSLEAA